MDLAIIDSFRKICIIPRMRKLLVVIFLCLLVCVSPESKARRILDLGLMDASPIIRINAAKALMNLGDTRGRELLIKTIGQDDQELQVNALNALYEAGYAELTPEVVKSCTSPEQTVREAAYQIVAASIDTGARSILVKGLNDKHAQVREVAYAGLAKFGVLDTMLQGLRDPEPQVRIAVARVLGKLGKEGMADFIGEELKKFRPDLWGRGIIALAELRDTARAGLFKRLLQEGTAELRVDAAEALLILRDESGVQTLVRSLKSEDPFVRIRSAEVLTRHDVPAAYEQLKNATSDEYVNVAVQAVEALARHDGVNQKEHFVRLMDASNPLLRISAAAACLRS